MLSNATLADSCATFASQRRSAFRGVPGSAPAHTKPESTSPGWENAIRAQEAPFITGSDSAATPKLKKHKKGVL
jgi:hypothetical protein